MFTILNLLLLLLPTAPLVLLLTSTSNSLRRTWLLCLAFSILALLLWTSLVNWIVLGERHVGLNTTLNMFEGVYLTVMRFFFTSMWPAAIYAILLGIAGYYANRYAINRADTHHK